MGETASKPNDTVINAAKLIATGILLLESNFFSAKSQMKLQAETLRTMISNSGM